jgi:hypothetical protein
LIGSWRKLHGEELHNYNDQVQEDKVGVACGMNRKEKECIWGINGKARRKEITTEILRHNMEWYGLD